MAETLVITGPTGVRYDVIKPLGKTEQFSMHACMLPDGQEAILKIVTDAGDNDLLDREAFLLKSLHSEALELEVAYDEVKKKGSKAKLNYQFAFPQVIESFVIPEQGDRRANILSFANICKELGELVPLEHLRTRAGLRIDPRTSAWILGKLLKIIAFAHNQGIVLGDKITGENILLNKEEHFVALFDWSGLTATGESVEVGFVRLDIRAAAEAVITAMGGDFELRKLPVHEDLVDNGYEEFVFNLMNGDYTSADDAHQEYYKLVRAIWPRGFHTFTAYPVS